MKKILEEYGKIIIGVLIGTSVIGIIMVGIQNWYSSSYPEVKNEEGIIVEISTEEPIIIVGNLEIESQDVEQEIDFSEYILAYEDSSRAVQLEVDITGAEKVNITEKGMYQIVCSVTNSQNLSFTKRVPVLIY